MNERGGGSGWSVLKVLGVIIGLIGLAGFGLCSVFGFAFGIRDPLVLGLTLIGVGLATASGYLVVAMFRSARRARDLGE